MKLKLSVILLFYSLNVLPGTADRVLDVRSEPVDINRTMWEFCPTEGDGERPLYRLYGDTLLTEFYGGSRQWYSLSVDSCHYLGEESRRHSLRPDRPIPTSAFGHSRLGSVREERDSGMYCHTYPLGSQGIYESLLPRHGKVIYEGKELKSATAVTEARRLMSINGDEEIITERRRTRWFVEGDILPFALQIDERIESGGREVSRHSDTFIAGEEIFSELLSDDIGSEDILENMEVTLTGNYLYLRGKIPAGLTLRFSLSEIGGVGVAGGDISSGADGRFQTIQLPDLRTGRYVLSLTHGTLSRKIFLTR